MRTVILLFILVFNIAAMKGFAQNDKPEPGYGEPVAQTQPHFPGGADSLAAFLGRHLRFPREAALKMEEGRVYVGFTVDKTGKIKDIMILSGVSEQVDKEAVKIVEKMPNWVPGSIGGQPVDMQSILPIDFVLPDTN